MSPRASFKRVLISGGTGFIGTNLTRKLLRSGVEVHLIGRPESDWRRLSSVRDQITPHQVSLTAPSELSQCCRDVQPDACFHLASYGSSSWQTDSSQIAELTCMGLVHFLRAASESGCKTFVNAGTSSEYGLKSTPPAEDARLEPNSEYAAAKAFATHWCRIMSKRYDMHVPTLRLYSVYGPWESTKRFIPALITAALAGGYPPLVDPDVARDFVHVDDALDAMLTIAERTDLPRDGVYNVGTGTQTTIGEAVAIAQECLGLTAKPQWGSMPNRNWDTTTWVADSAKIRAAINWTPRPFRQGFIETINWFREHHKIEDDPTSSQ